ncbi:ETC complex I subunit conserved region-domain-containing protein [Dipodascopsis tothii]|uniref:ETC complex I subunit conserved region-domain-containing protein n=1 Tax=Dipodascopsis tothii TaxID=44089 RepID=UPI0034CE3243
MRSTLSLLTKAYRVSSGAPTGLTGIFTHPAPLPALMSVYSQTLVELGKFPADSVYRQSVENLTRHRMAIVEKGGVNEVIEKQIGAGLIEEILIQAGEELSLTRKMLEWKPWEPLEEQPPETVWQYFDRK